MSKFVGYLSIQLLLFVPLCWGQEAIMPAQSQGTDLNPLQYVFLEREDLSSKSENKKIHFYQHLYQASMVSKEKCSSFVPVKYSSPWEESQAKRSVAAAVQFYGLSEITKVIGSYAKELEISDEDYQKLTQNLLGNFCSKNLTVMSLKRVEKLLQDSYEQGSREHLPQIQSSPFATEVFKQKAGTLGSFSRELDYAIRNFRAFCSWGGEIRDLRMLSPYLKNPFIIELVGRQLAGLAAVYDEKRGDFELKPTAEVPRVVCQDVVCRPTETKTFERHFPRTVGSISVKDDVERLYCDYFKNLEYSAGQTIPQVKGWIKEQEIEDPILETNFFISVMTKVPDLMFGIKNYNELPLLLKGSVDSRWNDWAKLVLSTFSQDILFEESMKIRPIPMRDPVYLAEKGFRLDFSVTVGELDRLHDDSDKLDVNFHIKLSKNYLRSLRVEWNILAKEVDIEGQGLLKDKIAKYLELQLKTKEPLFRQKMWNEKFSRIMAEELLSQVLVYQGSLFNSYEDQMLTVPIKFSYGIFALGYLRYRADVQANRMKLNL